jgi:hypothetical protein
MAEAEGYLGPNSDVIPDIIRDAERYIRQGESIAAAIDYAARIHGTAAHLLSPEEMKRIRQAL